MQTFTRETSAQPVCADQRQEDKPWEAYRLAYPTFLRREKKGSEPHIQWTNLAWIHRKQMSRWYLNKPQGLRKCCAAL